MTDTLTQLEDAARAGATIDPVEFAAAKVAADIDQLRLEGEAAERQDRRARARIESIDNILDDLLADSGQYEADLAGASERISEVVLELVQLADARTHRVATASSQLAQLDAVGPGKPAKYWTGILVDERRGFTSHTFANGASILAQLLRTTLPADTVATIRDSL